jgi:hypothetical protein
MAAGGRKNADGALLMALAAGRTVQEAAQLAGVSERTAYRRLADPEFARQVSAARAEMVERAVGRMSDGMIAAADRLRVLVDSHDERVALGASRSVLELTTKLRESLEWEQRLSALEELWKAKGSQ